MENIYAKGGKTKVKYDYVPQNAIDELSYTIDKVTKGISGDKLLSGVYIKSDDSPKTKSGSNLTAKILGMTEDEDKKEVILEKDVKEFQKYISDKLITAFYLGLPEAYDFKGDSSYGGGVITMQVDYAKKKTKEAIQNAKNKKFEIGLKYPQYDFEKLLGKPTIKDVEGKTTTFKDGSTEKYTYRLWIWKDCVIGQTIGSTSSRRGGYLDLTDGEEPTLKGGYKSVQTSNASKLESIINFMAKDKDGYVKDNNVLYNGLGGANFETLETNKIKYAKGGEMKTYDDFGKDYDAFTDYVMDRISLEERRKIRKQWEQSKSKMQWQDYLLKEVNKKSMAKGGMTDVERQSMIDMGYSEEQIKEAEDNPRRGGRFAQGGLISNVGTVDDFMLKELLMKNKKVLAILSDKEIAFMKLDNVDVIGVSGKNYDFIFTDGKKEFEIINQDRKLKHSLRDARPKIVEFYSKSYAKGGRTKHSYMQDRRRVSSEPWEVAYQKRKAKMEAGGTLPTPFGQAGLVGETGAMNEMDLFAMGGGLPQGVHQYYANTYNPAYPTPHGYAKGGITEKDKESLRKSGFSEAEIKDADERSKKGSDYAQTRFNPFFNTYAKGGRTKHSYMQDRRRISSQPWEVAYQKRKAKMEAGGTLPTPFGQVGLVGETGAMNEMDLFAMGGGLPQGVHQYYANTYNPAYPTPHGYAEGGEIPMTKLKKYKSLIEKHKAFNKFYEDTGEDYDYALEM
jgi:hypothetical protein